MGNFLSGSKARLIFNGSALGAAYLFNSDFWHENDEVVSFSKEDGHAF